MREIKIFLASSEELKNDRNSFGNLVRRLDRLYEPRGLRIILLMWEDFEQYYHGCRTQDFYNEKVRSSDMFVALFHRKAGEFTVEETEQAFDEYQQNHHHPKSFVYMRALVDGEVEEQELCDFKHKLYDQLGHYWSNYGNEDTMQLHFVLQLKKVENEVAVEVEDSKVKVDGMTVADLTRVPFAANNVLLQSLNNTIALLERNGLTGPELNKMREQKVQLEKDLVSTAQTIAALQLNGSSERLRKAIALFEQGDNKGADALLDPEEIAREAERNVSLYEAGLQARQAVISNIEEYKLKAQNLLTIYDRDSRFDEAENCYAQAYALAQRIHLDPDEMVSLLNSYHVFLLKNARYEHIHEIGEDYLSAARQYYGEAHPATANVYNNIGLVYKSQGDYEKALEYHEKALKIWLAAFGENHPDVATSYNNIGSVYDSQDGYGKALEKHEKQQKIRSANCHESHPYKKTIKEIIN